MSLSPDALKREVQKSSPDLAGPELDRMVEGVRLLREQDPFAPLREDVVGREDGGQFMMSRLAPNFEMAMYLAQATGASLITDSPIRWAEWCSVQQAAPILPAGLAELVEAVEQARFLVPRRPEHVLELCRTRFFAPYQAFFAELSRYVGALSVKPSKPNFEAHLVKRFNRIHEPAQKAIGQTPGPLMEGRMRCLLTPGGLQHNTVNRLLLMSSSEGHQPSVPMAFLFQVSAEKHGPLG